MDTKDIEYCKELIQREYDKYTDLLASQELPSPLIDVDFEDRYVDEGDGVIFINYNLDDSFIKQLSKFEGNGKLELIQRYSQPRVPGKSIRIDSYFYGSIVKLCKMEHSYTTKYTYFGIVGTKDIKEFPYKDELYGKGNKVFRFDNVLKGIKEIKDYDTLDSYLTYYYRDKKVIHNIKFVPSEELLGYAKSEIDFCIVNYLGKNEDYPIQAGGLVLSSKFGDYILSKLYNRNKSFDGFMKVVEYSIIIFTVVLVVLVLYIVFTR